MTIFTLNVRATWRKLSWTMPNINREKQQQTIWHLLIRMQQFLNINDILQAIVWEPRKKFWSHLSKFITGSSIIIVIKHSLKTWLTISNYNLALPVMNTMAIDAH